MKSRYHSHIKSKGQFIARPKKPATPEQGFRPDRAIPMSKREPKYPPFRVEG